MINVETRPRSRRWIVPGSGLMMTGQSKGYDMQEYYQFMRELRAATSHIGQKLTKEQACNRLNGEQSKKLKAKNFMTSEYVECRALAGIDDSGPLIAEISHGAFLDSRVIGITVFHVSPRDIERDHDLSGAVHSVDELRARLLELNGGE